MKDRSGHIRLLHTSDWHLGRSLYGKKRYPEFKAFLEWLALTVKKEDIDLLLVSGDVFDTVTPGNLYQELYYEFLCSVSNSPCSHVVITAGNHDSPAFLEAPRELLRAMKVYVLGRVTEDPKDEILVLRDERGDPEAIVCAAPYLRDKDMRKAVFGESSQEKEFKMAKAIEEHYRTLYSLGDEIRSKYSFPIPLVAMGHLFLSGGRTLEGDGVRDLYVGSLGAVDPEVFRGTFDYAALGHLHVAQSAGKMDFVRYSGSPIPMGFSEAKQAKTVCVVDFYGSKPSLKLLEIPLYQRLERIKGDMGQILKRLNDIGCDGTKPWLEVIYDGKDSFGDLRKQIEESVPEGAELLRLKDLRITEKILEAQDKTLEDLDHYMVFKMLLESHDVPEDRRPELLGTYREIVASIEEACEDEETEGPYVLDENLTQE